MNKFSSWCLIVVLCQSVWSQDTGSAIPAIENISDFRNLRDFTISSSGNEAYFTVQSPSGKVSVIVGVKKNEQGWSKPFIPSFSGKFHDLEPFFSPDNLNLYFASNRPLDRLGKASKDYDIWQVSRKNINASWNEPVNLGTTVNSEKNEFYPSITNNKNLYFTSDLSSSKGKDDIFVCTWNGEAYKAPMSLNESINSEGYEFNAFVAPDESYIIFSGYNREDGFGSGDLYISYRKDNNWEKAINMGDTINSEQMDYCPFVDINEKNLYFTSKRSQVAVEKKYNNLDDLLSEFEQYENGQSRLYKINIKNRIP